MTTKETYTSWYPLSTMAMFPFPPPLFFYKFLSFSITSCYNLSIHDYAHFTRMPTFFINTYNKKKERNTVINKDMPKTECTFSDSFHKDNQAMPHMKFPRFPIDPNQLYNSKSKNILTAPI